MCLVYVCSDMPRSAQNVYSLRDGFEMGRIAATRLLADTMIKHKTLRDWPDKNGERYAVRVFDIAVPLEFSITNAVR